jgi:hypothetical protein
MTKHINRRIFLRGVGGAVVAAPFLSSLAERGVKAQAAAAPKRLIMMFTHYGCITTKFFPKVSNGALTADMLSPTLQPLAPYIGKMLIPRGIRSMNEWTQNMARGQGNDPHTQVVGSYFTCQPVTPNSDNPFSFDQSTKFNAQPIGPSLDHVIAQALSADGKGTPMFMRVGNQTDTPQSGISYSAAQTLYPGLGNPSQAFSGLTGLFNSTTPGSTANMTPADYQAVRGKAITDLVKDDLDTLERSPMSQADKMKLDAWKELLNSMGTVMASAQCNQDIANMLGATSSNISAAGKGGLGSDILTTTVSGSLDGADIYSSVAALAAVCNANPVIVLKYPGSYVFKGLGITTESHSLSHRLDNAGMSGSCLANAVADLIKVDSYYTAKFANLLKLLDSMQEGNGTVLDNSATIWFSEMSDGNAHNLNNAPIIQAGSMGGYFKQGWTVNVDDGSASLSQGQSESQCTDGTTSQMANGLNQGTGTDPKVANAPINKYFLNILNAMGVKAGADGFPAKGGTAEVTKYGYSDKTEDFIHGGTNPATIHSPGEFMQLKAGS